MRILLTVLGGLWLSVAIGVQGVFATMGDYSPERNGITALSNPSGTGDVPSFNNFLDSSVLAEFRRQSGDSNYMDERDFLTVRKILTDTDLDAAQVYDHSLTDLEVGDEFWVQVYVHNNAEQVCGGDYSPDEISVDLDFSDVNQLTSTINARSDLDPGMEVWEYFDVMDSVDLALADGGDYTLSLVDSVFMVDRVDPDAGLCPEATENYAYQVNDLVSTDTNASSTVDLESVYGGYGNLKLVYFRLMVVENDSVSAGGTATGGGGGAPTSPTVGTCSVDLDTNAWQCVPRYPYRDLDDELYLKYDDCVELEDSTVESCLRDWAAAKDYMICGPVVDGVPHVPYVGSSNVDFVVVNEQCDFSVAEDLPVCTSDVSVDLRLEKKVANNVGVFVDDTKVALGDSVAYRVKVGINGEYLPEISEATIKVYDFTIPVESGGLWDRVGVSADWDFDDAGGRFYSRVLTDDEISRMKAGALDLSFDYEMMTTYLDEFHDVSSVKNVAFAVLEYKEDVGEGIAIKKTLGSNEVCALPNLSAADRIDAFAGSGATLGDWATVNIIRPFLDTKGGDAAIGGDERIVGGDYDGGFVLADDVNLDVFYQQLKLNLDYENPEIVGGAEFHTSLDSNGVYFVGDQGWPVVIADGIDLEGQSKTFVVDNGQNVAIIGDSYGNFKLENGFAAFIVRNGGNLIVDPGVSSMEGVFIVEGGGKVLSFDNMNSDKQLKLSGALIGDLESLLRRRRFIGDDPDVKLEPSVEVFFDFRLLEDTPPILEDVLGEGWGSR